MQDRKAFYAIGAISAAALALLFSLVYGTPPAHGPAWVGLLPPVNASLNASTTALMILGVISIKQGHRARHRGFMIAALCSSAIFLVSYLAYHRFHGDTHFGGQGWLRVVYFFILITHILLSMLVLPLLLTVVWFAGIGVFERHKRLARWVFPIWLYVSVSGVAVYFFLRPYY